MARSVHCILTFILLVTAAWPSLSAQSDQPDSLRQLIARRGDDSVKVDLLVELGTYAYNESDNSEALRAGDEARVLAEEIGYTKGLGFACNLMGLAYAALGNYPDADLQFEAGLEAFEQLDFKEGIAKTLTNLGTIYDEMGDATRSIEYHLQALRVAEVIDNKERIGITLFNIGSVYAAREPAGDRGLDYFLRALSIFEETGDQYGVALVSANTGTIYFNQGKYDSALVYFEDFVRMADGSAEASYGLRYLGEIYAVKRDFSRAFRYHDRAIELSDATGSRKYLAESLLSKARSQRRQGDVKNSIATYREALAIAEELRARPEIKQAYEALASAYAAIGDYRNAYAYESLLTQIKDTLYNTDEDKKIQAMQFNFDMEKKEAEIDLLNKDRQLQEVTIQRQRIVNWAAGITGILLLLMAIGMFHRYRYIQKTNRIIQAERDRSKELLLNILPEETARELETSGKAQTRYYESVTVLFTDFKGFSSIAGKMSPQDLVAELNVYFMAFDEIVARFGLEKIKTIGDAYMCAGGIPVKNDTHAFDAVEAALAMQEFMHEKRQELYGSGTPGWELRIGIHTGPVVAGVVGKKKYAYDIWGDTVNIASRMESNGEPGKVNISSSTFDLIKENYRSSHRGKISAKNIGEVDMYFIESEKTAASVSA
jgi:adenylate cyclase